jgi:hypothetical protein
LNEGNPWTGLTAHHDQLRARAGYWAAIGSGPEVLSWICYGLPCRPQSEPERVRFPNHSSYFEHFDFCDKEIMTSIADGLFEVTEPELAKLINPQQVEVNSKGKPRRCDDLRFFNAKLPYVKFRQSSLARNIPEVVDPGDLLWSADLTKAYYSLRLADDVAHYHCFEHKGLVILPRVLLFGQGLGPFYFSKCSSPITAFFRALRVKVLQYVDDWLFSAKPLDAERTCAFSVGILRMLGWKVNEKGQAVPGSDIPFLGLGIDADTHQFFSLRDKVLRAQLLIRSAAEQSEVGRVEIKLLERMTGFVQSQALAIPAVKVWMRQIYSEMAAGLKKGVLSISLSARADEELAMLFDLFENHNGAPIAIESSTSTFKLDAGETGVGCHAVDCSIEDFSEMLPVELIGSSSTHRELYTLKALLVKRGAEVGRRPTFTFDSADTVCILTKGSSPVQQLQDLVKEIYHLLQKHQIGPVYAWIPRAENVHADRLSKRWCQSWKLTYRSLARVAATWPGVPVRCDRFNTIGNILVQSRHSRKGTVILIVPHWPSQCWWPLLTERAIQTAFLGKASDVFEASWAQDRIGVGVPCWPIFAILI